MYLGDFHMHSTFSDGRMTIPELVDLYGSRGFGAIAITDHLVEEQTFLGKAAITLGQALGPATFPLYMEILRSETRRAWNEYRMVVIPGVEFSKNSIADHRSCHILGLGITEYIPADLDPIEICRRVRAQGGITIAAHPVAVRQAKFKPTFKIEKHHLYLWHNREAMKPHIDAWEVASGRVLFKEVLAQGLPMVASSDLHVRKQLTSWKTTFRCARNAGTVLNAIKNQDLGFEYYEEKTSHDGLNPELRPQLGRNWRSVFNLDDLRHAAALGNLAYTPAS